MISLKNIPRRIILTLLSFGMASCSANNSAESGVNNKPSKGETVTTNQTNSNIPTGADGGKQEVTQSETSEATSLNSANMELVIVEGVGKTEASAKKAAYKEAVAKVVGVLIDSSTLVKNDKIIEEELLEYSGGFVTKAELVSSKKDEEGLVRVKVRCVVEKAQIRKKLEDIKVLVVKIDGASFAASEMTKAELLKNATLIIDKAFNERKLIYSAILPKDLSSVEKDIDGLYLIPVKIQFDKAKQKQWSTNWFPLFEKLATKKSTFISKLSYDDTNVYWSDYENPLRKYYNDKDNNVKNGSMNIIVPESITSDNTIKWQHFQLPYDWSKSKTLALGKFNNLPLISSAPYMKLSIEISGNSDELLFTSESFGFGTFNSERNGQTNRTPFADEKTYGALDAIFLADSIGYGACVELPFFPCRKEIGLGRSLNHFTCSRPPDRTGVIFKAKIAEADLPKVSKIIAKIEWIDPKPAK